MNITLFGTGLMGHPMAESLANRGYSVTVYNRTRAKAEILTNAGIRVAPNPAEALCACECAILMLSDANAISETIFAESTAKHLNGRTVIQMGTIGPSESLRFHNATIALGGDYLEAPVLGSIPEARSGNLIVMVGAGQKQFDHWQDLLKSFGPSPLLIGPVGHAAAVKLAMNQLIGSLTAAFSLSLGIIESLGVDLERFMSVVRDSALYAPTFDKKLKRMIERDYANPNFPVKHLKKDIHLFIQEASEVGLAVETLVGLEQILEAAMANSHAEEDYSAINEVLNPPNLQ